MPVSVRVFIVDEDENLIPLEDPDEFDGSFFLAKKKRRASF